MASTSSPSDSGLQPHCSPLRDSSMSPLYGEHDFDVPHVYNLEEVNCAAVADSPPEPSFLPTALEGSPQSSLCTLPSVNFQPTHAGFDVSAQYPASGTMGATLLHFESTFPGSLATVHIESTGQHYLVTGAWIPTATLATHPTGRAPHIAGPAFYPSASACSGTPSTTHMKSKRSRRSWNKEDARKLQALVGGGASWKAIFDHFPDRTPAAVRSRVQTKRLVFGSSL